MNKFFTITRGVILVYLMEGIGFGEMPPVLPTTVGEATPRAEIRSDLPKALELTRYTALGKKSPFTLASATAEADFAKELVLGGYVRLEGEDYVMVANKTKPERILVGRKPSPSAQGMILLDLKKDPLGDPSKMQAKIKKGSEMATLKYEVTGGGRRAHCTSSCGDASPTTNPRNAGSTCPGADQSWAESANHRGTGAWNGNSAAGSSDSSGG